MWTSDRFLTLATIRDFSRRRPLRDVSSAARASVSSSVTRSRTSASCGSAPYPSGGSGGSAPSASWGVAEPGSMMSATPSLANRPRDRLTRKS